MNDTELCPECGEAFQGKKESETATIYFHPLVENFEEGLLEGSICVVEKEVKMNKTAFATPAPTPKVLPKLLREELVQLLELKYQRRVYVADDLKIFANSLMPEKAFALSRLLPNEVLFKLLNARGADTFSNNIIEYATSISKEGKVQEDAVKKAEDEFLVTHSIELVSMLGGTSY